jgi:hypothetical protein
MQLGLHSELTKAYAHIEQKTDVTLYGKIKITLILTKQNYVKLYIEKVILWTLLNAFSSKQWFKKKKSL